MSDDLGEKRPEPLDLSGRADLVPGPLTKPSPTIRPPKRRHRWVVPVIVLIVLAALATSLIIWAL